jgi:CysZ protein
MIRAFTLAVADLRHGALLSIWLKSAALALLLFVVVGVAVFWGMSHYLDAPNGFADGLGEEWQLTIFVILSTILAVLGAWFLFRAVILLLLGLFSDDVIAHVEGHHYPFAAAQAVRPALWPSLKLGLRSFVRIIGVNILVSPLYLLLLATGIGTWALFLAVNGWLFGKDLDEMVRAHHTTSNAARPLPPMTRTLLGLLGTVALSVPIVNLFVPILAVAMAVHISHQSKI